PPAGQGGAKVLFVESKRDLGSRRPDWIGVSATSVGPVCDALRDWFAGGVTAPWIGLQRHRDHAEEARGAVEEAIEMLGGDDKLELGAFALGVAAQRLGEITGRAATGPVGEEVLARIFARFCIGK
ncbi:MAG: hypothetical protein AAF721_08915, partial [Myxococcota bacterium]